MVFRSRRTVALLAGICTLAALAVAGTALAQKIPPIGGPGAPVPPKPPGKGATYDLGNLTLPNDDRLGEKIEFASERIKAKEWDRATNTLQELIGRNDDVFIPVSRPSAEGGESTIYVSVKKEAQRLIAAMPKAGRDFYEANYGPKAKAMVAQARTNNDFGLMAQALGLYLYTDAGADAASWLGTWMLDRAEFQGASRFFGILIARDGIEALKDKQLLKAAYAFHHGGDAAGKELVFKELARRNAEIKLREEALAAGDLKTMIDRMTTRVSLQSASDSPVYRGRPSRTAMLPGGAPFLEPSWKAEAAYGDDAKKIMTTADDHLRAKNMLPVHAFVPVTATMTKDGKKSALIIFRSFAGIRAVDMRTGKIDWDAKSDWDLDGVFNSGDKPNPDRVRAVKDWHDQWARAGRPQVIYENTILSTVSADSQRVYAVEDVPFPQYMQWNPAFGGVQPNASKEITEALNQNKLVAYDLAKQGKTSWEVGGPDNPLSDTFFLSPPLPLNGSLYVLTEKQQELSLLTLDPASGKLIRKQDLATTKGAKLSQDPIRRTQATHLAYGEGILVVPTNAGAVFGIDLLSNSLLWAYPYRKPGGGPPAPPPNPWGVLPPGWMRDPRTNQLYYVSNDQPWQVTAPAVAEGKVVFTAPDESDIHCVNLRDGSRAWSVPRRPDDLYLAGVYNGKAVVVGKSKTRGLSLAKGEVLWELDTGVPSGQGAAGAPNADGHIIYYLPVRKASNGTGPEICAINVDKGLVHAHTRSRKGDVPGNLLFYEGNVLSQNLLGVTAYPQLEVKLAEMDRLVKANPDDPAALTDRGDYLLDKGDLGGAIDDFRKALAGKPTPEVRSKARTKLFEAFTEYFQRDFSKAEKYLAEYEEMCKIDTSDMPAAEVTKAQAEMRRRRINFLYIVGKGRESQGKLVEAFERYLELGTDSKTDEPIQSVDEPSVKAAPDVWAQGRIAAMIAAAGNEEQKKAVEALIVARWNKVKASNSTEEFRRFVGLFGSLFGVGKQARMALAERLMDDTGINSGLEAEQQLAVLRADRDEATAAGAIEALARLNTRKGRLEDAAFYYRLLGEKFPKAAVNGKTGQDYLDDLATDKRFLPYLDQAGRFKVRGKVTLDSKTDNRGATTQSVYNFAQEGEALPFFVNHKIGLVLDWNNRLRITDMATGESKQLPLTPTAFQNITAATNSNTKVRFVFQNAGHLVVLQLGHMVFGIDPLGSGRVLWEENLLKERDEARDVSNYSPTSTVPDNRDDTVVLTYADGFVQRVGQTGPLNGGVVLFQRRETLTAFDPVSKRVLWTRNDINSRSRVFGDEGHVYVVGVGDDGKTAGTRVLRAYDGVNVRSVDFSKVYDDRLRVSGRNILAAQTDNKGGVTYRLFDVLEGKDLWSEKFEGGVTKLASEDPRLVGVIDKEMNVRVFDVEQRKEVMKSKILEADHLAGISSVSLVADEDYIYLLPFKQDANIVGTIQPNVQPGSGIRTVNVNGMMYAFNRKTGDVQWHEQMSNLQLVLTALDETPMVLLTSRYMEWQMVGGVRNNQRWVYKAIARAKHSGKMWYNSDNPGPSDIAMPQGHYFSSLAVDSRTGKVEFGGSSYRVVMTSEPAGKPKAGK